MATVDKNFRIKNGLAVEGSVATVNGNQILTENASDTYILNLIGGETLVKSVGTNLSVDNAGQLSLDLAGISSDIAGTRLYADGSSINVDVEGIADDLIGSFGIATTTNVTDAINTEVTNRNNAIATAKGEAGTIAQGYADDAETAANSYTDTRETAITAAYQNYADQAEIDAKAYTDTRETAITSAYQSYADTAEQDAKNYADDLINDASNLSTEVWSAYKTSTEIGLAQAAAEDYTDTAVANVVGAAPELLDTLNELAAALQDNPDIISDLQDVAAGKQDTLTAGSNIDITGSTISVTGLDAADISDFNTAALSATSAAYDAAGSASAAQTAAETFATNAANAADTSARGYADGLASNYDAAGSASAAQTAAEGYTDSAVTALTNGTTQFTEVNVAGYTRQVGSWAQAATAGTQIAAYAYSSGWGSAEFLVRVMSNTSGHQHSQLSKLLVTRDGAGNVAITEYGIVTTNGNMGDITADVSGGNIRILVTPTYASSEVIISGTLLAYND